MNRLSIACAALLVTGGVAAAQDQYDDDRWDRDRDSQRDYDSRDHDRDRNEDRDEWRRGDRDDDRRGEDRDRRMGMDRDHRRSGENSRGHHAMMMHHRGGMGHHGGIKGGGAEFTFERGDGQGKIKIECAAGDSTQDCVDAIRPLLEMVMSPDSRTRTTASPDVSVPDAGPTGNQITPSAPTDDDPDIGSPTDND